MGFPQPAAEINLIFSLRQHLAVTNCAGLLVIFCSVCVCVSVRCWDHASLLMVCISTGVCKHVCCDCTSVCLVFCFSLECVSVGFSAVTMFACGLIAAGRLSTAKGQ